MNSIDLSQYERVGGESFKFDNIGDTIEGKVTQVGQPFTRTNKFNGRDETILAIGITPDGGEQATIWPRLEPPSSMAEAVIEAVKGSGGKLEEGGTLAVKYAGDKDVGKPQPMKVFVARYTKPTGGINADDLLGF